MYDFKNLEPSPNDNVLIRYKKLKEKFEFQPVLTQSKNIMMR